MPRRKVADQPTAEETEKAIAEVVLDKDANDKLALAQLMSGGSVVSNFYMPNTVDGIAQTAGVIPDKLMVPREYHSVITMCYDFYQRGGIVTTVVNRLCEMAMTKISNGQRKTSDEANAYFDAVLHRRPSRLNRFLHTAAIEYFLSGMVLPRVDWDEVLGRDLSPDLNPSKVYKVPVVDLYPPKLVKVEWAGWGEKKYYLRIPDKDIRIIKRGDSNTIKEQQRKYLLWKEYMPDMVQAVKDGEKYILLETDAILRKEVSFTQYPSPFLFNILEPLIYKQQLRRMDYSVASRIITAILLVTEGSDMFPVTQENRGNLDNLQRQIQFYSQNPAMAQRLFPLFSNHTTKLEWIQPDVEAMLNQDKYRQVNDEIAEGLGFAQILITGESRNAQASEVSTWAIQPLMEELQEMFLEWLTEVYEEATAQNNFRYTPIPTFGPIRLQDFIKTAAVFAQAFKEGNISRTTRNAMMGVNFQSEVELMKDEKEIISAADFGDPLNFPQMPYDLNPLPNEEGGIGGGLGRPPAARNKGGRPTGSQNVPVNNRNQGVKPKGQQPTSRVKTTKAEFEPMEPQELLDAINDFMTSNGYSIGLKDILPENE